ncbi:MAG TPA: DUF4268 domain-containing protein [Allosphingosinicella sp.]|nr:DUF4268 domain-containing protein [Allosphingosinicella sp.]
MANLPSIGRLVDIDLREVWASEPYAFTPWLASEENLQFLAESLDLPGLELIRTEHPVDSFAADIVCRIVGTDHHVLIENQLEKTDHLHLGQLLTYAPRFDAKVIIWVARTFTDAHRAALDWLNRVTGESYAFFGVEVRAVRIGESLPAPLFDVVAKPNDWEKLAADRTASDPAATGMQAEAIAYWEAMDKMLADGGALQRRVRQPVKGQNLWIPMTSDGAVYIVLWRALGQKQCVGAYLAIYGNNREYYWDALKAARQTLDLEFGEPLEWSTNKTGTVHKIIARAFPSPPASEHWDAQQRWLLQKVNRFAEVFQPTISASRRTIRAGLEQAPQV